MLLQADPTVIYGMTEGRSTLGRRMLYSDYRHKSKYNTYINLGLPPTPICNPGKNAIRAVLHPEWNNFVYFVLGNNGQHIFSKEYKNHLINIKLTSKQRNLKNNN
ncbi:YceG-like super family C-terminal domain protein [Lyticum sinuosum]|uniref:YceG-like super family C-terminal domain protein n=1 Tax=Lyticum sinuosum TaxID=1332059 RepID=A0AAE4VL71_9RICK|nr:YceG-like super family C-terminal domain protein [Lyticum sinuosum]